MEGVYNTESGGDGGLPPSGGKTCCSGDVFGGIVQFDVTIDSITCSVPLLIVACRTMRLYPYFGGCVRIGQKRLFEASFRYLAK